MDYFAKKTRFTLSPAALLATLLILILISVASAAELVTAELDAPNNHVTVVQGQSANFTISVSASGALNCGVVASNPASATVHTVYSIDSAGVLSSNTPSSALNFFAGTPRQVHCNPDWTDAPNPYAVNASVSAAATTTPGNYTITLSTSAGTTSVSNPASPGLSDDTATTIIVEVLEAPSSPWTIDGFYSPVDMGDALNSVKGGSTVPLKFRIYDGSGVEQTDTSVVTVTMEPIQCPVTLEEPYPADQLTSGNTSLRYDMTEGQFIYNWKTPKQPNKCYSMTATTTGGVSITALFKLK